MRLGKVDEYHYNDVTIGIKFHMKESVEQIIEFCNLNDIKFYLKDPFFEQFQEICKLRTILISNWYSNISKKVLFSKYKIANISQNDHIIKVLFYSEDSAIDACKNISTLDIFGIAVLLV